MESGTDSPPPPPPPPSLLKLHSLPIHTSTSGMPRAAKVGHKKSRLGCQRCKARRVKVCGFMLSLLPISSRVHTDSSNSVMKRNPSVKVAEDMELNVYTLKFALKMSLLATTLKALSLADASPKSPSFRTSLLRQLPTSFHEH